MVARQLALGRVAAWCRSIFGHVPTSAPLRAAFDRPTILRASLIYGVRSSVRTCGGMPSRALQASARLRPPSAQALRGSIADADRVRLTYFVLVVAHGRVLSAVAAARRVSSRVTLSDADASGANEKQHGGRVSHSTATPMLVVRTPGTLLIRCGEPVG
jgi:hypothetical protein